MIKDVHINNPKRSLLRGVEFRYRLGSFTQSSEITGCFGGGCGWKSSGDCVLAEVGDSVLYHSLSGLASGQQIRVVCPRQRTTLPMAHPHNRRRHAITSRSPLLVFQLLLRRRSLTATFHTLNSYMNSFLLTLSVCNSLCMRICLDAILICRQKRPTYVCYICLV